MKTKLIVSLAALAAALLPVSAQAAGSTTTTGVVVAKEGLRGTFVVANRRGVATTVNGKLSTVRLGDVARVSGVRLKDGTLRSTSLQVVGHARTAVVRGVVVRRLAQRTLVSTGGSVITIQRRAAKRSLASRGLTAGTVARFGVSISGGRVREISASALSATSTVQVEGRVVTLAPFVVSVEGLPITIGLGSATLPPTLTVGDEVGLTVTVDSTNAFTLVSVDSSKSEAEADPGDDQGDDHNQPGQGQEVEVKGTVASSSASQIVVADTTGHQTTFVAGSGVTLPILATGTRVEAKGIRANGVVTLVRLEVKGQHDNGSSGSGSGSGGSGGGDDSDSDDGDGSGGGGGGDGGGGDD